MCPKFQDRGQHSRVAFAAKLISGCAVLALAAASALAHSGAAAPKAQILERDPDQAPITQQLTISLLDASARLASATRLKRAESHAELVAIARDRYDALKALVEVDPAEVLRVALPAEIRANLPAEAAPFLERDVQEVGQLEVYHVDHADPALDQYVYALNTADGKLSVHFAGTPTTHMTGEMVHASGIRIDNTLLLQSADNLTTTGTKAAALPNTLGAQKTLAILVNFTDEATQPYTPAYAQSMIFNSVSNFDYEASYQQTWLTGDVAGWFTINSSSTTCDYNTIASQAQHAATAAGYTLANYNRFVYVFPLNACGWSGMGSIGGNPSQAWINTNGTIQLHAVAHEMGHNFGLNHSHSLDCGSVSMASSGCTVDEYGDRFDTMGAPSINSPHFSAFQKERLGWLNAGISPPLTTLSSQTGSANFTIAPIEAVRDGTPRALKISRAAACGSASDYFYVESRQAIGFDNYLGGNTNVLNGVVVRTATPGSGNTSYLLDMTPATASWTDPALVAGIGFMDPLSGVTITPVSAGSAGATINVSYPPSTCTHTAPSITLTPAGTTWAAAGATATYAVTVTNNDSCNCASSGFNISAAVPAGWGANNPQVAGLAPGASASITLAISSPSSAAAAFYNIPSSATNAVNSSISASTNATVAIMGSLVVSAATDQASYTRPIKRNQTMNASVTTSVMSGGSPVSGASVSVQVRDAGGSITTLSGMTNTSGNVVVTYPIKSTSLAGTYGVSSTATFNGVTNTGTTSFAVK